MGFILGFLLELTQSNNPNAQSSRSNSRNAEKVKNRCGCGLGIIGILVGRSAFAIRDWAYPGYIDRDEAFARGMENARIHCADSGKVSTNECRTIALSDIYKADDGWSLTFESRHRYHSEDLWIGRRGEYDSMGYTSLTPDEASKSKD
jgi:hypothetical protein